jgi:uncharacterized membrane protein
LDGHVVALALPFLIGFFAGLRSLTAPIVEDMVAIAGSLWTVS